MKGLTLIVFAWIVAAPAQAIDITAWMDRCLARADELHQTNTDPKLDAAADGVDIVCLTGPSNTCVFSEDPRSCFSAYLNRIRQLSSEARRDLPKAVPGDGFRQSSINRQLDEIHGAGLGADCSEEFHEKQKLQNEMFGVERQMGDLCHFSSLVREASTLRSVRRRIDRLDKK